MLVYSVETTEKKSGNSNSTETSRVVTEKKINGLSEEEMIKLVEKCALIVDKGLSNANLAKPSILSLKWKSESNHLIVKEVLGKVLGYYLDKV